MVMQCNEIAEAIGCAHRCNRRKCERDRRYQVKIYSTKNHNHHEFIHMLFKKMTCNIAGRDRFSRSMMRTVEAKFGSKFECCTFFERLIRKQIKNEKELASKISEDNRNRKKRKSRRTLYHQHRHLLLQI